MPFVEVVGNASNVAPEQIGATVVNEETAAVGFTTIVVIKGVPKHPPAVGVMVKVTVTGAMVVLVKIPLILPEPLAAIPVAAITLSLVQLNSVSLALLDKAIEAIVFPEQTNWEAGNAVAVKSGR